jgi:hypothetical protein
MGQGERTSAFWRGSLDNARNHSLDPGRLLSSAQEDGEASAASHRNRTGCALARGSTWNRVWALLFVPWSLELWFGGGVCAWTAAW